MKLETFESYQSSMMGFGHNRISESVGALTPVSLQAVREEQNLDQLESLCETCENMNLNPIWYTSQTTQNKRKLLQIFQLSIKYAKEVQRIYQPDVRKIQRTVTQKRNQIKKRKQKIRNHRDKVQKKKDKYRKQKLLIQKLKAEKHYLKLKKIRDKLIEDRKIERQRQMEINQHQQNQQNSPQVIYLQQPYMPPQGFSPQMYAAQQQQLQHQSQPQPFFNQYSQQVPQNIQQPYIPPEQQNIPQQQYVPQNLHPQINTQAPYQNLQYKNPETPININILPEQSSNNIQHQQKKQQKKQQKRQVKKPEVKKPEIKKQEKNFFFLESEKEKKSKKSEPSILGTESDHNLSKVTNSIMLNQHSREHRRQKSVVIHKINSSEEDNILDDEEIKRSNILRSTTKTRKQDAVKRSTYMKQSNAQISEATSEKYDDVGDLQDFSRVQMGTKIGRLQSNISANSMITDYDLGSIMDINLNQQSKGDFSPRKQKNSKMQRKISLAEEIQDNVKQKKQAQEKLKREQEKEKEKIKLKVEQEENISEDTGSYMMKSNRGGSEIAEKKFQSVHVKVKENQYIERALSPEDKSQPRQSYSPLKESNNEKQYDFLRSSNQGKQTKGVGKQVSVPFAGKNLKLKGDNEKSNSIQKSYGEAKRDSDIIDEQQEQYEDDFEDSIGSPKIHIDSSQEDKPSKSTHRFCPLFHKTFSLKNQTLSIHSSNSFSQIGSLKQMSIILTKSRNKALKESNKGKYQTDSEVDFDMMDLPQNSTIAKPSQLKKSKIHKSKIQGKIGKSSPRPPVKHFSSELSSEKKIETDRNIASDKSDEQFQKVPNKFVQTRIRKKSNESQEKKEDPKKEGKKKEAKKQELDIEMAESLMLNIEDQERKPTQIEQDLIIEELTEKSSEVEQKQKKEMQKRMRNLIKNKYNNTPEISEPINTKILKQQIKRVIKGKNQEQLSSEDIIKIFQTKIDKQKQKIKDRRQLLQKKQIEKRNVRELTTSYNTKGQNNNKSSEQDQLTYSQSLLQMNYSKKEQDKKTGQQKRERKNSDEEKKPPSKFAMESKKTTGNKLSTIKEKSELYSADDEVQNAVKHMKTQKIEEEEQDF